MEDIQILVDGNSDFYCKFVETKCVFDDNSIYLESPGVRYINLSLEEYLEEIRSHIGELIINLKDSSDSSSTFI